MNLAALLFAGWQAMAAAELDGSRPRACLLRFVDEDTPRILVLEKRRAADGHVITALSFNEIGTTSLRLVTATQDSALLLKPVAPHRGEGFRAEADLEAHDGGAYLIRELGLSGGTLQLGDADGEESLAIPGPLRHDVLANYLNCAGDLVADHEGR